MNITEVVDPNNISYYNVNDDKVNTRERDDTRKLKLMLKDINKLKKIRALKKLSALKRQDVLELMYGSSGGDEGGGFGGPSF